jgi:hypothetical protein
MKKVWKKAFLGSLLTILTNQSFAANISNKLPLTGGVNSIEGAAGGGLTPWAFIGGNGTKDQIGANAFYTNVHLSDYNLVSAGAMIGLCDRVELSYAQQSFDTKDVGKTLGLGYGFKLKQNILGVKIKLIGDGVLDQDSWLPQISIGAQFKKNTESDIVKSLNAQSGSGTDFYISATKIFLSQSLLVSATVRRTKANQLGLLGFGGDSNNHYKAQVEGSIAYLLTRKLALGAEYRSKPDNLKVAKEEDWKDLFIAWAPTKNISLTGAYGWFGNIALQDNQTGLYTSIQIGF